MGAGEPNQDGLVVLGPKGPLEAQLRYLMNSWPSQFAIAVVKAAKAPNCDTPEKGPAVSGNTTYCWLEVRPVDWIMVKWLNNSPRAPGDAFTIHYWFPKDDKAIDVQGRKELIIFLTPTHGQDIYGTTTIIVASDANRESVRKALTSLLR
jgi:hypothetical protein